MEPTAVLPDRPPTTTQSLTTEKPAVHREQNFVRACHLHAHGFELVGFGPALQYIFSDPHGKAVEVANDASNGGESESVKLFHAMGHLKRAREQESRKRQRELDSNRKTVAMPDSKAKGYRVSLPPGVLELREPLGGAVYLLIWAIDRATREYVTPQGRRVALVLGGKPLKDEEIRQELCSAGKTVKTKTIGRWRKDAVRLGLIRQHRTPYGHQLAVMDTMKLSKDKLKYDPPEWTYLSSLSTRKRT